MQEGQMNENAHYRWSWFRQGARLLMKFMRRISALITKPFATGLDPYPAVELNASDQQKIKRDFATVGKDLYRSLDEYAEAIDEKRNRCQVPRE